MEPSKSHHQKSAHAPHVHIQSKTDVSTIAIIGLGYVGLPLALLAEERGYKVIGFDIDEEKIAQLKTKRAPFLSADEATSFAKSNMKIDLDPRAIADADTFIVCVPTPVHENHIPDLEPLESASRTVGRALKEGDLVIVESTVNPGVCETISLGIMEEESGLKAGIDFSFAHCPERINPGDPNFSVRTIPRVIGGFDEESLHRSVALYRKLLDAKIVPMESIKEAEAVKMVENSFRDINIAFVNELAMSFAKAGIDIDNVIRGASSKPFGFMAHYPGCGVGGHCIPVDPYYLIRYGRENGFEHRFLIAAREINNGMPAYTVDQAAQALAENGMDLKNATVALLGLSYKRNVPDLRESPALVIKKELETRGAKVRVFDPFLPSQSDVRTLQDALVGVDAVILATDHTALTSLTPQEMVANGIQVLIDGRNALPKEEFLAHGITYRGIGR